MKTAFLFPGHASAIVGMPATWSKRSEHVRRLMDAAASHAGLPVARLQSSAALSRTSSFQPALTALSLGIWLELEDRGLQSDLTSGHSLGELSASAACGCMLPEDAVAVAAVRGRVMEREAALHPGGMLAVTARDLCSAEAAISAAAARGPIVVAGSNMRDQWVVSGAWPALAHVAATTNAIPLPVGGAWHSPLIEGAAEEYHAALAATLTRPLTRPLVSNREGRVVTDHTELVGLLVGQLTHRLDWLGCVRTFEALGVSDFVICGPSRALARFVATGLPASRIHGVEWPDDLERVREALAS
jgi:[acyl-carrier-protein] S-malonyltransferase